MNAENRHMRLLELCIPGNKNSILANIRRTSGVIHDYPPALACFTPRITRVRHLAANP